MVEQAPGHGHGHGLISPDKLEAYATLRQPVGSVGAKKRPTRP